MYSFRKKGKVKIEGSASENIKNKKINILLKEIIRDSEKSESEQTSNSQSTKNVFLEWKGN
ncbi:MAG: hypothetical protein ACPK85_09935 [Methanosarcina sp.]